MSLLLIDDILAALKPHKNNFILRQIGAQALLYPVVQEVSSLDAYVTLNELGLALWQQLIVAEKSPETVFASILAQYDCSLEELQADSLAFLEKLSAFMLQQH